MLNNSWKLSVLLLLLGLALLLTQCDQEKSPTGPVLPGQLKDFGAGIAVSHEYEAFKQGETLEVNIPEAGDYRLDCTSRGGVFALLFRLTESALVAVELQAGDEVLEASLQKGTLTPVSQQTTQALEFFEEGTMTFRADPEFGTLTLIQDGVVFEPTPTPTPTATPTPEIVYPTPTPLASPTAGPNPTPSDAIVIVTLGDSITYGVGSASGGYPPMLEYKLQSAGYNVIVNNLGVPGEKAHETAAHLHSSLSGADIALLLIGTNNIIDQWNCPEPDFCNLVSHIQAMANTAQDMGVPLLVSTIIPIHTESHYNWANPHVQQINSQIYANVNAIIVDNYSALLNYGGNALLADGLHPNDQGCDVMAWEWYNAILNHHLIHP